MNNNDEQIESNTPGELAETVRKKRKNTKPIKNFLIHNENEVHICMSLLVIVLLFICFILIVGEM